MPSIESGGPDMSKVFRDEEHSSDLEEPATPNKVIDQYRNGDPEIEPEDVRNAIPEGEYIGARAKESILAEDERRRCERSIAKTKLIMEAEKRSSEEISMMSLEEFEKLADEEKVNLAKTFLFQKYETRTSELRDALNSLQDEDSDKQVKYSSDITKTNLTNLDKIIAELDSITPEIAYAAIHSGVTVRRLNFLYMLLQSDELWTDNLEGDDKRAAFILNHIKVPTAGSVEKTTGEEALYLSLMTMESETQNYYNTERVILNRIIRDSRLGVFSEYGLLKSGFFRYDKTPKLKEALSTVERTIGPGQEEHLADKDGWSSPIMDVGYVAAKIDQDISQPSIHKVPSSLMGEASQRWEAATINFLKLLERVQDGRLSPNDLKPRKLDRYDIGLENAYEIPEAA